MLMLIWRKEMDDSQCVSVIRVAGYGGCGNSGVVSSCHIFVADTEEILRENMGKTLSEWLWGEKDTKMTKEEFETRKKDEEKIKDLINGEKLVEIESFSEQWENLNSFCEFTQIEEIKAVSFDDSFSAGKKAAITKKAKKEGKNPVMVLAGHKAAFARKISN